MQVRIGDRRAVARRALMTIFTARAGVEMEFVEPSHLAPTRRAARKAGVTAFARHWKRVRSDRTVVALAVAVTVEALAARAARIGALRAQATGEVDLCNALRVIERMPGAEHVHRFDVTLHAVEAAGDTNRDVRRVPGETDVGKDAREITRW